MISVIAKGLVGMEVDDRGILTIMNEKHPSSSVKREGFIVWACMAATYTDLLLF